MTSGKTTRRGHRADMFVVSALGLALGAGLLPVAGCESKPLEDPGPAEAAQVTEFISVWVAEQAGEGGAYDIPARGGHDVSGTMGEFHTVHRRDDDTYFVCLDFHDGENLYDVDFVVDQTDGGLSLDEHYLHKVNGEVVPAP